MAVDKEIIKKCLNNNRKAQLALYKYCYSFLLSIGLRYKHNKEDAESLLNQAFMKILKNLSSYKGDVVFEAWIRRIMINTVIDEYRKEKRHRELFQYNYLDDEHNSTVQVDYNKADLMFNAEELQLLLLELTPMTQKIFNLYAIDGYAHKEIAEMMGLSEGTSKWHVSVARKKLKELISLKLNEKLVKDNERQRA